MDKVFLHYSGKEVHGVLYCTILLVPFMEKIMQLIHAFSRLCVDGISKSTG